MLKQTVALMIFSLVGVMGAGCNQTVQSRPPETQSSPAPQTGNSNSSSSSRVSQVELANLRADVNSLDRRVREMNLTLEELTNRQRGLESDLERLKSDRDGQLRDVVRRDRLESAISDVNRRIREANSELSRELLAKVTEQIQELGEQTQAAIDSMARSSAPRQQRNDPARSSETFSDDFPQEGITYTVQSGDTLSSIAARHNSRVQYIQNANRIADPTRIQVGQVLFIPQRED